MPNYLVTGGLGFVGSHLTSVLLDIPDARVTVIDFSARMLLSLDRDLPGRCSLALHDVTLPIGPDLQGRFDVICADRLINRFTEVEAGRALQQILGLGRLGAEFRTAVRFGLYERDLPLIEAGRRHGTLAEFYDESTSTIDYGKTGGLLDELIADHGNIPRDVLLSFYRERGPEKRFQRADLEQLAASARSGDRGFAIKRVELARGNAADHFFTLEVRPC